MILVQLPNRKNEKKVWRLNKKQYLCALEKMPRSIVEIGYFSDDLVAQPVEHIPFKDGVLGSNPSQVTIKGQNSII